jgi:dihydrofolate reductase
MDPDIDFNAMLSQYDTLLIGRRTYEPMVKAGRVGMPGMKAYVISTTLRQEDHPQVTIIKENVNERVAALRAEAGKDIWLFGGGILFQSLLDAGLVDVVEVAIIPIILGGGIRLLPSVPNHAKLQLMSHRIFEKTGTVLLTYAVSRAS